MMTATCSSSFGVKGAFWKNFFPNLSLPAAASVLYVAKVDDSADGLMPMSAARAAALGYAFITPRPT